VRDVLNVVAIVALAAALGAALRFALVEPQPMALACDPAPFADLACGARWAAIQAFVNDRLALLALALALLATMTRRRGLAGLGLGAGTAAAVLYSAGLGTPAALLAALVFARPAPLAASSASSAA
jgi:hypothetical protein